MSLQIITITLPPLNVSVQVGDLVYWSETIISSGINAPTVFNTATIENITQWAEVRGVNRANNTLEVVWDNAAGIPLPLDGAFIFFSKNKKANTSSLVGYYANVNFVNNSNEKIELFSVGSEISESSK